MTQAGSRRDARSYLRSIRKGINTPRAQIGVKNKHFARSAYEIGRSERVGPSNLEKMYEIE